MRFILGPIAVALALAAGCAPTPQDTANEFLRTYDALLQKMYAITAEAYWNAATDVTELHVGRAHRCREDDGRVCRQSVGH